MPGDMYLLAKEIGLEQSFWEYPESLIQYSDFSPLKKDVPRWERNLDRCEEDIIEKFQSDIEEHDLEKIGAVSCDWSDI